MLKGCNFAMGYLDSIIIYSRSEKEHLEHLEEIFTQLKAAGLKLKLEKMLFLQKAHTVPRTLNLHRRNPTPTRKTRKHSQNASTQKPKRSETVPCPSRLLQKICSQICRHLKSSNTLNKEGCGIQVDPQM